MWRRPIRTLEREIYVPLAAAGDKSLVNAHFQAEPSDRRRVERRESSGRGREHGAVTFRRDEEGKTNEGKEDGEGKGGGVEGGVDISSRRKVSKNQQKHNLVKTCFFLHFFSFLTTVKNKVLAAILKKIPQVTAIAFCRNAQRQFVAFAIRRGAVRQVGPNCSLRRRETEQQQQTDERRDGGFHH